MKKIKNMFRGGKETLSSGKEKLTEMKQSGQEKLKEIQEKPWAEPTAAALGATGEIINGLGSGIPGVGFIGGALKVASSLLNPDIKLADLRRTENAVLKGQTLITEDIGAIQEEVNKRFNEVALEMKKMNANVKMIKEVMDEIYLIISDIHYRDGPEKVEALYEMFLEDCQNTQKTFELFKGFVVEARMNYNQHLKPQKVAEYLKIVKDRQGNKACQDFYNYIIIVMGKYLQIMSLFYIYNDDASQIGVLFERFNTDFMSLNKRFNNIVNDSGAKIEIEHDEQRITEEYSETNNKEVYNLCKQNINETLDEKMQKIATLVPVSEKVFSSKYFQQSSFRKDIAVGIDLGTTYCCAAAWVNGKVEVICNERGNRTTPSFAGFANDEVLIGESAKARIARNPRNTVFDAKSLLGRSFDQLKTSRLIKHWPFEVIDADGDVFYKIVCDPEIYILSPVEVSAMMLRKMKIISEEHLDQEIKRAVITVPANFNLEQRRATKEAGMLAGLEVMRIIDEPTAAAVAYGTEYKESGEKTVLVFDLGGGSFDVSVLIFEEGIYEVRSTSGNNDLGGENFDNRLVDHLIKDIEQKLGICVTKNQKVVRRLKKEVEEAKHLLSEYLKANLMIENVKDDVDFSTVVTRTTFEELCSDLFGELLEQVEIALKRAKKNKCDIDEIVLIGGSTRIPKIQSMLQDFFDGKLLNRSINPLEAVASGAAIQAAMLSGCIDDPISDILLIDATPHSLGIETEGGVMSCLIKRGTSIATKQTRTFTTTMDDQPAVTIQVFEGEGAMAKDNVLLQRFNLTGIQPAPKGVPRIEVAFDLDCNSRFFIAAYDKTTQNRKVVELAEKNESIVDSTGCYEIFPIRELTIKEEGINNQRRGN